MSSNNVWIGLLTSVGKKLHLGTFQYLRFAFLSRSWHNMHVRNFGESQMQDLGRMSVPEAANRPGRAP